MLFLQANTRWSDTNNQRMNTSEEHCQNNGQKGTGGHVSVILKRVKIVK
jgi:hypothetical protein